MGSESAKKVDQLSTFGRPQSTAELFLVRGWGIEQVCGDALPAVRDVQRVESAVLGHQATLDEASLRQCIHHADDKTGADTETLRDRVLGSAAVGGDVEQEHGLTWTQAVGGEAVPPQSWGMEAQLRQQKSRTGRRQTTPDLPIYRFVHRSFSS
jgi:hypothetical protein